MKNKHGSMVLVANHNGSARPLTEADPVEDDLEDDPFPSVTGRVYGVRSTKSRNRSRGPEFKLLFLMIFCYVMSWLLLCG